MTTNGNHQTLEHTWATDPRWKGITRPYTEKDVKQSARLAADRAHPGAGWARNGFGICCMPNPCRRARRADRQPGGAAGRRRPAGHLPQRLASGRRRQQRRTNVSGPILYPADSVPNVVRRINQALTRADQIHHAEGKNDTYWFAPIVADAEAGFGGNLNAFELMKAMIEAGAAGVHFEDQLSSAKKCGHLGGKVLVPTVEGIQKLVAARLAADVMGVPTVIVARTDADSANLLTTDIDPRDHEFITGQRTAEGFLPYSRRA